MTGDERQTDSWEAAAQEPDIPRTDARAVDPHQHLSRGGYRVRSVHQLHTVDPVKLLRHRHPHASSLTLERRLRVAFAALNGGASAFWVMWRFDATGGRAAQPPWGT